jgi:predicted nucleic acid-binding protein
VSVTRYVLDTNVVVQLLRGNEVGNRIDASWGLTAAPVPAFLSAVSLGEIRSLAKQWSWGPAKIARLHALLLKFVTVDIRRGPVVAQYVEIDDYSRSVGRRMNQNDLWIAAVAAATGATLLTMDRDFDHLDQLNQSMLRLIWIDPKGPTTS